MVLHFLLFMLTMQTTDPWFSKQEPNVRNLLTLYGTLQLSVHKAAGKIIILARPMVKLNIHMLNKSCVL